MTATLTRRGPAPWTPSASPGAKAIRPGEAEGADAETAAAVAVAAVGKLDVADLDAELAKMAEWLPTEAERTNPHRGLAAGELPVARPFPERLRTVAAAALFQPEHRYVWDEIRDYLGADVGEMRAACPDGRIGEACTVVPGGPGQRDQKAWPGAIVQNFVRRTRFPISPPAWARLQIGSFLKGLKADTLSKETAARAVDRRAEFYRDVAARCPALVDVLTVLDRMAAEELTAAQVLAIVQN
jgi:hypothetical protein